MINIKKTIATAVTAGVMMASLAMPALGAAGYSLFGGATLVPEGLSAPNAVQLVTDVGNSSTADDFSGIDYTIPSGTTFADLDILSTDFKFKSGTCAQGSPRYQINLDNGAGDTGNIFVYFGTDSGGAPCAPSVWQNTGDVLQTGRLLDTSQLDLGTFYDPYDTALLKYGAYQVTGIQVVSDSFSAVGAHTVLIDNTNVDGTVYDYDPNTPSNKEQCKKGGWQNLEDANGQPFRNQGQCVSYFNHQ